MIHSVTSLEWRLGRYKKLRHLSLIARQVSLCNPTSSHQRDFLRFPHFHFHTQFTFTFCSGNPICNKKCFWPPSLFPFVQLLPRYKPILPTAQWTKPLRNSELRILPKMITLAPIFSSQNYFRWKYLDVREGVQMKKTFLNGHCPDRSYPPPPRGATGNVVLFFGRQKRHLGAYYRIKF